MRFFHSIFLHSGLMWVRKRNKLNFLQRQQDSTVHIMSHSIAFANLTFTFSIIRCRLVNELLQQLYRITAGRDGVFFYARAIWCKMLFILRGIFGVPKNLLSDKVVFLFDIYRLSHRHDWHDKIMEKWLYKEASGSCSSNLSQPRRKVIHTHENIHISCHRHGNSIGNLYAQMQEQ